ncbi:MAG TPA: DUF4157 domain-containing protein [Candidatus Udaeobacter sp.]|jgi:hypothetical protein|nr:DUF4157 domain-containing protein [Candidatus Udaeobacter sp.]
MGRNHSSVPPIVPEVLRSPGQPLDSTTRAFIEPRFGYDFSKVRVHTDTKAAESARAVNALAYTVGRDVVFETGRYSPTSEPGQRLLAHELAHVVQQRQGASTIGRSAEGTPLRVGPADDAYEREADQSAIRLGVGPSMQPRGLSSVLQRKDDGKKAPAPQPAKPQPGTEPKPPAAKAKVKKLTVTKKGDGFDDFEAKRGGGKSLGYHNGWDSGSWYANFRFLVTVEVDGDIDKCTYQQTLNKTTSFSTSSGDDTYTELNNRPLKTQEWVKVSGSTVMWEDAPGITSDAGKGKADLPYSFKGDFNQSATGEDGEKVAVSWNVDYELSKDEKWTRSKDGLDKSASHS